MPTQLSRYTCIQPSSPGRRRLAPRVQLMTLGHVAPALAGAVWLALPPDPARAADSHVTVGWPHEEASQSPAVAAPSDSPAGELVEPGATAPASMSTTG